MFFRMSAGPQRIPEFTHIHAGRIGIAEIDQNGRNQVVKIRFMLSTVWLQLLVGTFGMRLRYHSGAVCRLDDRTG